jgi:hypothetical protein
MLLTVPIGPTFQRTFFPRHATPISNIDRTRDFGFYPLQSSSQTQWTSSDRSASSWLASEPRLPALLQHRCDSESPETNQRPTPVGRADCFINPPLHPQDIAPEIFPRIEQSPACLVHTTLPQRSFSAIHRTIAIRVPTNRTSYKAAALCLPVAIKKATEPSVDDLVFIHSQSNTTTCATLCPQCLATMTTSRPGGTTPPVMPVAPSTRRRLSKHAAPGLRVRWI